MSRGNINSFRRVTVKPFEHQVAYINTNNKYTFPFLLIILDTFRFIG